MADENAKIGPTFTEILRQGFQDLRDANDGKMAMGAPPIEPPVQQPDAPSAEPGSYAAAIQAQRDTAPARPEPSQDQEMSR